MKLTPQEYFDSLRGRRVSFIGAGVSHRELIPRFARARALVTLCDKKSEEELGDFARELKELGVELKLGEGYLDDLKSADIVFRSPGVDYTKPEIQAAVSAGVEVTSEIETFFALCPCRTVGVTGSDGKTTTTTLTARILERAGYNVHLGGNLGTPLLPIIDKIAPDDLAVVELSSFQLISMKSSPDFALVTNVTPNHLDHHKDMHEYVDAKRNLLLRQSVNGEAVLFADNEITREMAGDVKGALRWFSLNEVDDGAYIGGDTLYKVIDGERTALLDLREIKLLGAHNRLNVAAAAALTMTLACDDAIREAALEFTGVEHRLELVRELRGVRWYNDSIGTSPTRTIAGLRSFEQKVILIAGGFDKNISYAPLAPDILERVKYLLLCGPTGTTIRREVETLGERGLVIEDVADIPAAVARAAQIASDGDIVLLSPASASFDAYSNFEKRGEHFKELVRELK